MQRHPFTRAAWLALPFALLGCGQLLGLNDFSEQPASGGAAGMSGNAGTGGSVAGSAGVGAQAAGGTGGSAGTLTGGTAGANDGCTPVYVDSQSFEPFRGPMAAVYSLDLLTKLGDPATTDRLKILMYQPTEGTYPVNDLAHQKVSECTACVTLLTDVDELGQPTGARYVAEEGTVSVEILSSIINAPHKGNVADLRLVEALFDPEADQYTKVDGGSCLRITRAPWDFVELRYPEATIAAIQTGSLKNRSRVYLTGSTVTAIGSDSLWIQQGVGGNSGIQVRCGNKPTKFMDIAVGDQITVKGVYTENDYLHTSQVTVCEDQEYASLSGNGYNAVATTVSGSASAEEWEGVFVRLTGPFTLGEVVPGEYRSYTLIPSQGASFVVRTELYDPTIDPGIAGFLPGATVSSITGVIHSVLPDVLEIFPRGSADLENYTPAP